LRLLTIGSSGAEDFCPSSQTRAQLLRRVVILGHRTIRWLLSPRSISAPTVRPTLVFLHRWFIRRYTDALVPPVITVRRRFSSLTLTRAARAHPRRLPPVCRPSPPPATICVRKPPRRPSAVPRARRRPPRLYTTSKSARAAAATRLGFGRPRGFRPSAATSARRRSQGSAQGSRLHPQPSTVAHSFTVVRPSLVSPFLCT
jgi:hypothetical protein